MIAAFRLRDGRLLLLDMDLSPSMKIIGVHREPRNGAPVNAFQVAHELRTEADEIQKAAEEMLGADWNRCGIRYPLTAIRNAFALCSKDRGHSGEHGAFRDEKP